MEIQNQSISFLNFPLELIWFIVMHLTMSEFSSFYRSSNDIYRMIHASNLFWTESRRSLEHSLAVDPPKILPPFQRKRNLYKCQLLALECDDRVNLALSESDYLIPNSSISYCDKEDYVKFYSKYADIYQPERITLRKEGKIARKIYYTRIVRDCWYLFGLNPIWNLLFLCCFMAFSVLVGLYLLNIRSMYFSFLIISHVAVFGFQLSMPIIMLTYWVPYCQVAFNTLISVFVGVNCMLSINF
jgi:hypothetical protein